MKSELDKLKKQAEILPNLPGVYRFLDESQTVIYVGKAKDLRKRVVSYFRSNGDVKTQIMLRRAVDVKHLVTQTEADALLLENNLIKKLQPRYNVLLKDDKTFPWVCIKNEMFPRITLTRRKQNDGSRYFGPYTSIGTLKILLDLIRQIYPLRTCRLHFSTEAILRKKYKVCLEYHLGNCKGVCVGEQSDDEYAEMLKQAIEIIKGNIGDVVKLLKMKMNDAAEKLKFEEAQLYKDQLVRLENYQAKSIIVNPSINNVDVVSLITDSDSMAYANFMRVVKGSVVQIYTFEIKLGIAEEKENLLSMIIIEMEQRIGSLSHEIIVPFMPDTELKDKLFTVPQRGDRFKLLELSEKNARAYRNERLIHMKRTDPEKHTEWILNSIKTDLQLNELPRRIECFDNSNIQGTNPVAACVVFLDARPSKKEYRHFNVKTVEGPDDFASMEEIVYRRYKRRLDEEQELPQLIVIDGGKGQLHAAVNSLEKLGLYGKIPILGLAKRLEEIYFPNDSVPLYLNKNSETLKILMHIRDEAHRFGISFHRNKRSMKFIVSELTTIKGIGSLTAQKLMRELKTISAIKEASEEIIAKIVGKHQAKLIINHFENTK
ncbi:MAG: excinuclease ABC subunit UvrC [Prevotellaceae bacterium]|jgi:excinuclease ABC subunit C|nr:excinuclease ABC subunit UvrC [Prevotellaceae bacterium]